MNGCIMGSTEIFKVIPFVARYQVCGKHLAVWEQYIDPIVHLDAAVFSSYHGSSFRISSCWQIDSLLELSESGFPRGFVHTSCQLNIPLCE